MTDQRATDEHRRIAVIVAAATAIKRTQERKEHAATEQRET
jgi:hypothetical protein